MGRRTKHNLFIFITSNFWLDDNYAGLNALICVKCPANRLLLVKKLFEIVWGPAVSHLCT